MRGVICISSHTLYAGHEGSYETLPLVLTHKVTLGKCLERTFTTASQREPLSALESFV